ncbi:MAG: hypothetical protein Q8L41_04465 [Anaerolineales bacterium]|nr:hypothetical protein [Anaerolineales bacterium]MDP2776342.1 hypothetical protein [Anaerolineales bacterium]
MRKTFIGIGSLLQTPAGVIIITTIIWHGILWGSKIPLNSYVSIAIFFADLGIAFYLLDRLVYFFSQFVLPIQNPQDRQEIYSRVKLFESGDRGPTLFIKNGRVIEHEGEAGKRGPGILVLDTASAAVLRTDTEISTTVGPGIKFTKADEYIAGSVDLRSQWQFIGPLVSDQPFLNPAPIASSKSHNELQSRSQKTSGLTRDGFEISPTISIKFSIKRPVEDKPTESGVTSRYGFDPTSVRNAITREVIRLGASDNSKARMEWNKLPAHLVVNLWREYIRKFKFEELFTTEEISGLQTIEDMINKRVRQHHVVGLDDTGIPTGEWLESLEYKQLQLRGLEIREVRIHNVLFEPSIEEQTIQQWSAEWMNIAKQEERYLNEKESLIETAARDEAGKKFARIVSGKFGGKVTMPQQNPFKTLQLLIQPLKDFILTESNANSDMEKELRKLDEIWKWLLDQSMESTLKEEEAG